jgi:hypothetical protein
MYEHHRFSNRCLDIQPFDVSMLDEEQEAAWLGHGIHAFSDGMGMDDEEGDRMLSLARHVVVPGRADGVRRRIEGILSLVEAADLHIGEVVGITTENHGWVVVEIVDSDEAVHLVELLGTALAEVSGRRIVALVGADPVCEVIERATVNHVPLELNPHRTLVFAAADEEEDQDQD